VVSGDDSAGLRPAVQSFRDLLVWEEAMNLAILSYKSTESFPKSEIYGLVSQIRSSASSISANIAEGSGRRTTADFLHFLDVANGSLRELESHFELAKRLGYIESLHEIEEQLEKVGKMLTRFKQSLRNCSNQPVI
jgi:four helix bundle protein